MPLAEAANHNVTAFVVNAGTLQQPEPNRSIFLRCVQHQHVHRPRLGFLQGGILLRNLSRLMIWHPPGGSITSRHVDLLLPRGREGHISDHHRRRWINQMLHGLRKVHIFIVDVHIVRQVVSHAFSVPWEVFVEGSSIGRVALPHSTQPCTMGLIRINHEVIGLGSGRLLINEHGFLPAFPGHKNVQISSVGDDVLIAHRTQQRSLREHEGHVVPPEEVAEVHQHLEHQICATVAVTLAGLRIA
mmetsp:Transcript_44308/g.96444  ORF Transcript_44308/g.96444 Transcript_44308/m.96444 type:complete len:244 (+) Transcript_44308:1049-1780(+)